ncbi:thioredoxin-dependent thiol peroxidase [Spirochaeta africana]|uniref:thioredoxin-dependent peroxiredoxin n=1 Tax=Spirochaeta africana (strain ATCC 700263 / DSM 8902 / Z-7692) TaxID=889378 RepID=H9UM99_SPIAZ|nr:thioredoxin-dependent thiol peroxidase [Spirochaeta africana]AFG38642.1 Peroxiredoxin [Spirochaeta africana DSM 8902]
MLSPGDTAPDFTLTDASGQPVTLAQFRGKKVVVYFYPKDNTPGCTTQACGLRDAYQDILDKGAVVVGISADSEASHARFQSKYELPFHLVSDPEKIAISAFGAWGEKKMYGKVYQGITRCTFIIDETGTIAHVFPKVSPKTHADKVLEVL